MIWYINILLILCLMMMFITIKFERTSPKELVKAALFALCVGLFIKYAVVMTTGETPREIIINEIR
jgi:hypothetical protein